MIAVMAAVLTANPTVAAPGFQCSGIDQALCDAYLEHFVGRVTDRGLKVTTKNDLAELLGLERQRQLLGCADQGSSCIAELVGALGVGRLLSGSVAKTESGFLATLKVIDVSGGATLWSATEPLDDERALFKFFDRSAESLVERVSPRTGAPIVRWIPAMFGAAAVLTGVVAFAISEGAAGRLREYSVAPERFTWTIEDIRGTSSAGRLGQIVGVGAFILGGLSGAASLLWLVLAPSAPAAAVVVPTASGASVSIAWALP